MEDEEPSPSPPLSVVQPNEAAESSPPPTSSWPQQKDPPPSGDEADMKSEPTHGGAAASSDPSHKLPNPLPPGMRPPPISSTSVVEPR